MCVCVFVRVCVCVCVFVFKQSIFHEKNAIQCNSLSVLGLVSIQTLPSLGLIALLRLKNQFYLTI